jgi:hypothetical protein
MSDRRFAEGQDLQSRARRDNDAPEQDPGVVEAPGEAPTFPAVPAPVPADTSGSEPGAGQGLDQATDPRAPAVAKAAGAHTGGSVDHTGGFFQGSATEKLRDRWQGIQIDFVDDPRHAVEQADTLLEQVAAQLTDSIATRRRELRVRWNYDGTGSAAADSGSPTEELRTSLQDYRRLLNRLLET